MQALVLGTQLVLVPGTEQGLALGTGLVLDMGLADKLTLASMRLVCMGSRIQLLLEDIGKLASWRYQLECCMGRPELVGTGTGWHRSSSKASS